MTAFRESTCPGCGLRMPIGRSTPYRGYYNTSAECWNVYTEVIGEEFSNALLFGRVHQLTVDTYAVQHAGGAHPDKSIVVHLAGLHLVLDRGVAPTKVPELLQRLAGAVEVWPHFPRPSDTGPMTVLDIALCDSPEQHITSVREWAGLVWEAWSRYHADVTKLASQFGLSHKRS